MPPLPSSLSGPALHSGVPSTVRITRRPDDGLGIRFLFPGFGGPLDARALGGLRRSARRATVLEGPDGAVIRTPEHMLAAALFFAGESLDVACDAAEPPGLDGSARPWFTAFAAVAEKPGRRPEQASGLTWEHAGREGWIRAVPAPHFSVAYSLERGAFQDAFHLESLDAAPLEILPARTFIFWKDWKAISRDGLIGGANAESGLLLAENPGEHAEARTMLAESRGGTFPLIHPSSLRFPAEAARHKILDLIGDLALSGLALPKLRLEIRNGGHALNHLLLDHLQADSRRG
jgi:UDP-3-O-acyl-N-acetylglucosamine deacetylase